MNNIYIIIAWMERISNEERRNEQMIFPIASMEETKEKIQVSNVEIRGDK